MKIIWRALTFLILAIAGAEPAEAMNIKRLLLAPGRMIRKIVVLAELDYLAGKQENRLRAMLAETELKK